MIALLVEKSHLLALNTLVQDIKHSICFQCIKILLTDKNFKVSAPEHSLAVVLEWINHDIEIRQEHLQDLLEVLPLSDMSQGIISPYLPHPVFNKQPQCKIYVQEQLIRRNPQTGIVLH